MTNLNTTEKQVLNSVIESAKMNDGSFTYIDDVMHELVEENNSLSINQVKGYLSQLQTKKYIQCCEEGQICAGNMFEYSNFYEPIYVVAQ
jgi:hypothetical protein|tara:strand:- start:291 stop:560 length:270 start_codon:yes stop_codon:yes gene_type:complete